MNCITPKSLLALSAFLSFWIAACGEHPSLDPEDTAVAFVGDHIITVSDFRRNYEFGFPNLKTGPNKKRSYLNFMIKEKVLALHGYHLNLDKSERVQKLEDGLLNELLVEALFARDVKNKINVSQEEIKRAITKSKVQWKLRYWVDETRRYFMQGLKVDEMGTRKYYERHKDRYKIDSDGEPEYSDFSDRVARDAYLKNARTLLTREVDTLIGSEYPVVINEAVLDTIRVTDFKKSRWASVHIFKKSTNRPAFPIVDPSWSL